MKLVFFASFLYFFLLNNKNQSFACVERLVPCMLFNYFNIYFLNVLRVPQTHVTPVFADLKVSVYGVKGKCLWG